MNVLLTCVGRRNYLVRYFKDVVGAAGRVYGADSSPSAPALADVDCGFIVPPVTDQGYFDEIIGLCQLHNIRLLVSLNDLELPQLARERGRFETIGCTPVVSSQEVVNLCFDKWETIRFLEANGLRAPKSFLSVDEAAAALRTRELTYPVVVKPRWGTASIGIDFAEDEEELRAVYELLQKRLRRTILRNASESEPGKGIIIQEQVEGLEYGLDVVNDLEGNHQAVFVKQKLSMRAGETDRAVTADHPGLSEIGARVGRALRHIGNLDCDVFLNGDQATVLEMNPRFGGGYPFSHLAGANVPAALVAWASKKNPNPEWLTIEYGVTGSKYDQVVQM